jgi:hypothetical protein
MPSQEQINIVLSSSKDGKMITVSDFVRAREQLWSRTYASKPALKSDKLSTQEHIMLMSRDVCFLGALSGNSNQGKFQISKQYAQSILFSERLPNGWKKTAQPLGIPQLLQCLSAQGMAWAHNEFTGMVEISKHWFGFGFL